MVQEVIRKLQALGPLPPSHSADPDALDAYVDLMQTIARPVSDDEARILVTLFGVDDCFGVFWIFIHAIETAPGWPLRDCLKDRISYGVEILKQRCRNSGYTDI